MSTISSSSSSSIPKTQIEPDGEIGPNTKFYLNLNFSYYQLFKSIENDLSRKDASTIDLRELDIEIVESYTLCNFKEILEKANHVFTFAVVLTALPERKSNNNQVNFKAHYFDAVNLEKGLKHSPFHPFTRETIKKILFFSNSEESPFIFNYLFTRYTADENRSAEEFVQMYLKATIDEIPQEQFHVGIAYQEKLHVEQNWKEAVKWYTKAARNGHCESQFYLALCYENGTGVKANKSAAYFWYFQAATKGYPEAQFKVGYNLINGIGVNKNHKAGVMWLIRAASNLHNEAQNLLAKCFESGNGVKQNFKLAFKFYQKAAIANHVQAKFSLAVCYEYGIGTEKNPTLALEWYRNAADNNCVDALVYLGSCFENGKEGFIPQNPTKAVDYYKKAAPLSPKAKFNLAKCYKKGFGTLKSMKKALQFFREAKKEGFFKYPLNVKFLQKNLLIKSD